MASLVTVLMNDGFEFCYTQTPNIKGISKTSIKDRFKIFRPAVVINYLNSTYQMNLVFNSEDEDFVYVEDIDA